MTSSSGARAARSITDLPVRPSLPASDSAAASASRDAVVARVADASVNRCAFMRSSSADAGMMSIGAGDTNTSEGAPGMHRSRTLVGVTTLTILLAAWASAPAQDPGAAQPATRPAAAAAPQFEQYQLVILRAGDN